MSFIRQESLFDIQDLYDLEQLNQVRYRTGKRAKVHFDIVHLFYNASKLACDRLSAQAKSLDQAA